MLRIRLFGALEISLGERPVQPLATRKSQHLLAYLLLHRERMHRREALAELFWPLPGVDGRRCLRTEIWRIRSRFEEAGASPPPVVSDGEHLGIDNGCDLWLDVDEFESALDVPERPAALTDAQRDCLERSVGLYRGDLLEGVEDHWCSVERERLRSRLLGTLERLVHDHESNERWEAAIRPCSRLLSFDPLREPAHRELMRCYSRLGDRAAALRQFRICAGLLRDELQIEPMPETVSLYREIRGKRASRWSPRPGRRLLEPKAAGAPRPGEITGDLRRALEYLGAADRLVGSARRLLSKTLRDLER